MWALSGNASFSFQMSRLNLASDSMSLCDLCPERWAPAA
jgi:hypothetical protein